MVVYVKKKKKVTALMKLQVSSYCYSKEKKKTVWL